MNTFSSKNKPAVISDNGDVRFIDTFAYDDQTEVRAKLFQIEAIKLKVNYSCSVNFQNEMFIFGGMFIKDQISKVTGCSMTRIGTLDFDFNGGGCANFEDRSIILCVRGHYF